MNPWRKTCLYLAVLTLALGQVKPAFAQWKPKFIVADPFAEIPAKLQKDLLSSKDSLDAALVMNIHASLMQNEGWLEYSFQGLKLDGDSLLLQIHQGPRYIFSELRFDGLGEAYISRAGLERWQKAKRPVNWKLLEKGLEKCLQLFQEEGYPFASFQKGDLHFTKEEGQIMTEVSYAFQSGPLIRIDSIEIKGNIRENLNFVTGLIRLRKGDVYQHSRISEIPRILNNSIYYQKAQKAQVTFTPFETARLVLNLEQKKSGKFDVLIGFLPNPDQNSDRRLRVTGSMDILLVSPLKQGEIIQLKYESLIEGTQNTVVGIKLPYILRTPLKAEAQLNLYQQEEDFLNVNFSATGIYAFNPFLEGKFFVERRQTILLGDSTAFNQLENPPELDGNRTIFGGGGSYKKLDFQQNPSKGWDVELRLGVGQRAISENPLAPEAWYEGRPLVQPIQVVELEAHRYFSLFPRNVLHIANQTRWLGAPEYFRNDQWQIGGIQNLRGFNENQFLTDFFSLSTLEYRFQLEQRSFLVAFADWAYLRDRVNDLSLQPLGLGIGMNYGTKAGILSIYYAVGRSSQQAFRPSSGKIHLGFVNQF
ncbi:MAG: BamA/TamA family outer membrane protein [Bacteroidia bacterium]|nr:BamA/TamA family outer membrane protein [Bacteroidia bacterium]